MKKYWLIILLLYFFYEGHTQTSFLKMGIEPTFNIPFFAHLAGLPKGFNLFVNQNKHELYFGVDLFQLSKRRSHIIGLESGYKHHFFTDKRQSHFYLDFNIQASKWGQGCVWNVNYNYINSENECHNIFRERGLLISPLIGYEFWLRNFMSTYLSAGPGLNYHHGERINPNMIMTSKDHKEFSPVFLVKAGLRFSATVKKVL